MLKPYVLVDDFEVPELVLRLLPWTAVKAMTGSQEILENPTLSDAFGIPNESLKDACHAYDRLREGERPITRQSGNLTVNRVVDENSVTEVSNNHLIVHLLN